MKRGIKVLLSFDSFKDSLGSREIGNSIADSLTGVFSKSGKYEVEYTNLPLSDGGEGFIKCLEPILVDDSDVSCKKYSFEVVGPFPEKEKHSVSYLVLNGSLGIMDLASQSGIEFIPESKRNPYYTSTYGLGELIKYVKKKHNIKQLLLGVGGSSTNDCGFGALQAMGLEFLPEELNKKVLIGKDILEIKSFKKMEKYYNEKSKKFKLLEDLEIEIACDVENPFCGDFGAAIVYGKQKGMDSVQQKEMDNAMFVIRDEIEKLTGIDLCKIKGTGAAGGISGGFITFQQATVKPGIELFSKYSSLEEKVKEADVVFSGEGRYDYQTIRHGKAVSYVEKLAEKYKKPMIIVCGKNEVKERNNVFDLISSFQLQDCMKKTEDCLKKLIQMKFDKLPFFKDLKM